MNVVKPYAFPQQPAAVLAATIERISIELPGFQSAQRGKQMAQLVMDQKPDLAVEIGVYGGRSLIPVALAMKLNSRGMIFGIDPWSEKIHHEGLSNSIGDGDIRQPDLDNAWNKLWGAVEELGLQPYVNIVRARSSDVFMAPCMLGQIGILHIDGAHHEDIAYKDALVFGTMVKKGGFIWVDDTDWVSLKKALSLIETFADCVADEGTYRLYHVR